MNSIPPRDLERLAKCLSLAGSCNQHEALSALQKAQAILAKYKVEWKDLLSPSPPGPTQPRQGPAPDGVLATLSEWVPEHRRQQLTQSRLEFLSSVREFFLEHEEITIRQKAVATKIFRSLEINPRQALQLLLAT